MSSCTVVSATDVVVRRLSQGDDNALFAFYDRVHPKAATLRTLFAWRREMPNDAGSSEVFGAFAGEALLGALTVLPIPTAGGRRVCWQLDSIVAPEARGKGIGQRLVCEAKASWDIVLAKGTSDAMYALRKGVGFADVPHSMYLYRATRAVATGVSWKIRIALPALFIRAGGRPRTRLGVAIVPLGHFGPVYDEFADAWRAESGVIAPVKSAAYLRWRYLTCPNRTYQVLELRAGGRVLGAAVLRRSRIVPSVTWLVDLISSPYHAPDAAAMIASVLDAARQQGVSIVRTFCSDPYLAVVMREAGFREAPSSPRFTCLPRSAAGAGARIAFWHGDGDVELYQE
ncbi:MAG: GNAT family N-acetyltransferase [Gemmatimonadota bacterium]